MFPFHKLWNSLVQVITTWTQAERREQQMSVLIINNDPNSNSHTTNWTSSKERLRRVINVSRIKHGSCTGIGSKTVAAQPNGMQCAPETPRFLKTLIHKLESTRCRRIHWHEVNIHTCIIKVKQKHTVCWPLRNLHTVYQILPKLWYACTSICSMRSKPKLSF